MFIKISVSEQPLRSLFLTSVFLKRKEDTCMAKQHHRYPPAIFPILCGDLMKELFLNGPSHATTYSSDIRQSPWQPCVRPPLQE